MDYIVNSETEGIDFTRYSRYIESIRDLLPSHIYAFASDSQYFDLSSPSTLHDAWLESFDVREIAIGKRQEIRRMEATVILLGAFHDRLIRLHYTGITRYSFQAPPQYGKARYEHTAHGDLITHEIRLGHEGLFIHELLFERGATFFVECADIQHSEQPIKEETYHNIGTIT